MAEGFVIVLLVHSSELVGFLSARSWEIRRSIRAGPNASTSRFYGTAKFTRNLDAWIYDERGRLDFEGRAYPASRRYVYRPMGSFVAVDFADGRPFYTIDCDRLPKTVFSHRCGYDLYEGQLQLHRSTWSCDWRVTGPSKFFEILTDYR